MYADGCERPGSSACSVSASLGAIVLVSLAKTRTTQLAAALALLSFVATTCVVDEAWARRRRRPKKKAAVTSVELMSTTAGAEVYIDDKMIGKVPIEEPIVLTPGSHSLKVQKRGFTPHIDTIKLSKGEQKELEVDLVPSGGVVKLSSNVRRAQVLLDGKPIGRTPFDGDIAPGKHKLEVVSPGKLRETRLIEVRAGELLKLEVLLKDVPPPIVNKDNSLFGKWWFWTGVGAVVVTGVTVGVLSARTIELAPQAPDRTIELP